MASHEHLRPEEQPRRFPVNLEAFSLDADSPLHFQLSRFDVSIEHVPVDSDGLSWGTDYIITAPDQFNPDDNLGFKGLRNGESVVLGRSNNYGRFDFPETVSREHVRITRNGAEVLVEDLGSTNGTWKVETPTETLKTPTLKDKTPYDEPLAQIIEGTSTAETAESKITIHGTSKASEKHPDYNDDNLFINTDNASAGVFDGVGGAAGSEAASRIAAAKVNEVLAEVGSDAKRDEARAAIEQAANEAHKAILEHPVPGIATTATVVRVFNNPSGSKYAVIGSVGDSRAYLLRDGEVQDMTLDQGIGASADPEEAARIQAVLSEVTDFDDMSEEDYRLFKRRNIITGCLGSGSGEDPDVQLSDFELLPGDQILLTTDGVHDNLTTGEIESIAKRYPQPDQLSDNLVLASQLRSRDRSHIRAKADDITAVVIDVSK